MIKEFYESPRVPVEINEAQVEVDLNPEQVSELLFYSFYYSQGAVNLQTHVLAYIATKHSNWKIKEPEKEKAYQLCLERNKKFVETGFHERQYPQKIDAETKLRFDILCSLLNDKTIEAPDSSLQTPDDFPLETLLSGILSRDWRYIEMGGRPNRSENVKTPYLQPQKSHFIDYVLLGEKAPGPAVFTEMIEDLRRIIQDLDGHYGEYADDVRKDIVSFLEACNEANPEKKIDIAQYPYLS